jgi:hypothetical protein
MISNTFFAKEIPLLRSNTYFSPFRYRIPAIFTAYVFIFAYSLAYLSFSIFVSFLFFGLIGLSISTYFGRIAIKLFTLVYAISSIGTVFFYFIFLVQYEIPYGGGGSDSLAYEQLAKLLRNSDLRYNSEEIGILIDLPYHNSKGYIYLINLFIRFGDFFGGFHTMIPRLFNCTILGMSSVVVYSICKKISLTGEQSLKSGLITGLFPIMIYVSVQSLRDIPIVFILLIAVSASISIIKTKAILKRILCTLLFVPLIFIIMEFRLLNTINILLVLLVGWFVYLFSVKRLSNYYLALFIAGFVIVYNSLSFLDIPLVINLISKLDSSSADLAEGVDRSMEGGLSLILFNLPEPLKFFASIAYSFITPLPIVYTKDFDWNFLALGTIYQFLFIPFVYLGLKNSFRLRLMLPILSMFLISYLGYVFGTFTFRHITYIVPFAAIYGVIGYEKYKYRSHFIWSIAGGLLVLLLFIYYSIKIIS